MLAKNIFVLMAVLALCYSTAPSWIVKGVSLNYTVGSDMLSFTVVDNAGGDLKIDIKNLSSSKSYKATENASVDSGQFWFDSSVLASASTGETIGDYVVSEESKQTFAGKEWSIIALQTKVRGATIRKVYEKQTGLLLKQTTSVGEVPIITLVQYYIPGVATTELPPVSNQPPTNMTTPPASPSPSQNTTQSDPPPSQNTGTTNTGSGSNTQPVASEPGITQTIVAEEPCLAASLIFAMIGFAMARRD